MNTRRTGLDSILFQVVENDGINSSSRRRAIQATNARNSEDPNNNMVTEDESVQESRYHRQAALLENQGWDQGKLTDARVAVIGSGALAHYSALTLSAFGFGHIELYGQGKIDAKISASFNRGRQDIPRSTIIKAYSDGFMYYESREGQSRAKALEEIISKINPEIRFSGINLGLQRPENAALLGQQDLIIEATNDIESKLTVLEYARQRNIPVVSMSAGQHKGGIGIYSSNDHTNQQKFENLLFYDQKNEAQDPIVSQVISGIGIEEARKIINPMNGENPLEDIVIYNLLANDRFSHNLNKNIDVPYDLSGKNVCLVGAGALGNFVGLGLALRNVGNLVVVDFDTTEITNLNRQILLYDGVGNSKARALVTKLKAINPDGNYRAKVDKITPESGEFFKRNNFDLIIDTVDNNKARAVINYFALKYDIPFISGGTRYNSGQVNIYVPGESGCLNCQADIDQLALGNYRRDRENHSCIYAAQPSVITSNQITGGLMVGEATNVLDRAYGDFAKGEIKFVSNESDRMKLLPPPVNSCGCRHDKESLDNWLEKMRGVYDGN
ncbi:ThiF family adenylyltransferase [Candidatus Woesearchaeota archaeon]|nr:ThiF family adenylyltransferase [Candidatus Woesearchaeota archaeon]